MFLRLRLNRESSTPTTNSSVFANSPAGGLLSPPAISTHELNRGKEGLGFRVQGLGFLTRGKEGEGGRGATQASPKNGGDGCEREADQL